MTIVAVLIGLLLIIFLYVIMVYNGLVRKRNNMKEGWSSIDVFLKKRYDLIPNLVETVKGYATHEKDLLENVTKARNMAKSASTVQEQAQAETKLNSALMNVMAVSENYPDLQASQNFRELQNELSSLEDEIEMARRYYNSTVKDNNNAIETFPSNIIASQFKFEKGEFFEMENPSERQPVKVQF